MKKVFVVGMVLLIAMNMVFAAGAAETSSTKGMIGVVMPTRSEERWNKDGEAVKTGLEALGYRVDLQ
ncbi:MAG: sugar ABC transporter substrate-binding protein, partial [Sphaerochaetaceae bacterium]